MAEIDNIVQITISKGTTAVATASFQIAAILAPTTEFTERSKNYTDVPDDISPNSEIYKIASTLFGQTNVGARPASIVVGRRQVDSVDFTPTVANNTVYTVTINGTAYSYTSDANATAAEIADGLDLAIGTLAGVNATSAAGVLTVSLATPGTTWTITSSSNLAAEYETTSETWTESLQEFIESDNSWYALTIPSHDPDVVEEVSDFVNARRKIFGTSSQDPAIIQANSTTDISAVLSAKNAGRTLGIYLPTADEDYPEAAWIGAQLAYTPGSNDWDFKRLNGVTVSKIGDTARTVLRSKNTNMYTTVAGVNIMQDGNMYNKDPIDEVIFIDWLYARLQEQVIFRLINSLKQPYTNEGFTVIENEIRSVLAQAEANGGIDTGWTVTVPDVLDVAANLRAQRIAGVFKFKARLAGSIRAVRIEGSLEV